jgi:hypothetical protein
MTTLNPNQELQENPNPPPKPLMLNLAPRECKLQIRHTGTQCTCTWSTCRTPITVPSSQSSPRRPGHRRRRRGSGESEGDGVRGLRMRGRRETEGSEAYFSPRGHLTGGPATQEGHRGRGLPRREAT